ncbi:MAG: hypothetical protein ACM3OC_09820 [Deltaproteobacteria bacterium]
MVSSKIKAQVNLEFVLTFTMLVLFLIGATRLFVWLGKSIIDRNRAYETTASTGPHTSPTYVITLPGSSTPDKTPVAAPPVDFYTEKNGKTKLTIFGTGAQ